MTIGKKLKKIEALDRRNDKPVLNEEVLPMAGKSFGEEFGEEFARKAVLWGPAIAGAALLGPAGIVLGFLTSVATITSGNGNSPPSGGQDADDRK